MADSVLTTTRRDILGVISSLPVAGLAATAIAVTPVLATTSRAEWDAVKSAYIRAEKALNDYFRDHMEPAAERWEAWRGTWPSGTDFKSHPVASVESAAQRAFYDPIEEQFDALVDQRSDSLEAMIATPAPDAAAITFKMEVIVTDERWDCNGFEHMMHDLLSDLRHLGEAA